MAEPKSFHLSSGIHDYVLAHSTAIDEIQRDLIAETLEATGGFAGMQISPEQGIFMTLLTRAIGARDAVEVGTFTGYSSLAIARGLPADGHLLCCDVSEEWTAIARRYWARAGLADRITLEIGPAVDTLAALDAGPQFDLAFIDADKGNYAVYGRMALERLRPGGIVIADNAIRSGRIALTGQGGGNDGIRALHDLLAGDDLVATTVPVGDGLAIAVKKG